VSRQDWTEKCAALRTRTGGHVCTDHDDVADIAWTNTDKTNCPFPVARGYDHADKEVCVTTRIFQMDVDGTPVDASNALISTHSFDSAGKTCDHGSDTSVQTVDFSKRSTYLFKYDAKDVAGNYAEQIVFALILDDSEAPIFAATCKDSTTKFETAITVEAVSDWELCELTAYDNIDEANIEATKYTITHLFGEAACTHCTADKRELFGNLNHRGNNNPGPLSTYAEAKQYFKSKNNKGPDHVGKYLVSFQTEDRAGIYGHNAANNMCTVQQAILVRDTVQPTIFLEGNSPDFTECVRSDERSVGNGEFETYMFEESDCQDQLDTVALEEYLPVTTTIGSISNTVGQCGTPAYAKAGRKAPDLTWKAGAELLAGLNQGQCGKTTTLTMTCDDQCGNTAKAVTRVVNTVDTHQPTLYLTNDVAAANGHTDANRIGAPQDLATHVVEYIVTTDDASHSVSNMDSQYGAWAKDSCDVSVNNAAISKSWGPRAFNTKLLGDYVRTYTVSDFCGNSAIKTRTYTVIDQDLPEITVMNCAKSTGPDCEIEATRDEEYTDTGATCHDFIDGELSHAVEVSGEVVNLRIPGTYVITYNCQDLSGNEAVSQSRTVVVKDTTCPVIELLGAKLNYVEAGFPYVDGGATATDSLDGDVTQYIWTDGNTIDTIRGASSCQQIHDRMIAKGKQFNDGEYSLLTKAANGGVESHTDDSTSTLQGVHCFKHGKDVLSFKFLAAGPATCASIGMANYGKNVPKAVKNYIAAIGDSASFGNLNAKLCKLAPAGPTDTWSGAEPKQVTGRYEITYHVEDKEGNANCDSVTRSVVVKDTLPPVITLSLKDKLIHTSDGSQVGIGHKMISGVKKGSFPTQYNPAGYSKTTYATKAGEASYVNFGNPYLMAESTTVNGWVIGAVASAVAGVALLGFSQKKTTTTVPV